jgi:glucuronoarabinoxylan endo-1,4-beta-xylanase
MKLVQCKSSFLRNCFAAIAVISATAITTGCGKDKNTGTGGSTPIVTVDAAVTIAATQNHQTIQGFGCATVFTPPGTTLYTSNEFDRLFGTGNGKVGLSLLRIRVASDEPWRAVELNHAKLAIQNGARVFATPWSPPANMKTNNNIIGGALKTDSSAAYAKYLNDFANYMAANGAPLYAVSVQNEPDWNPSYEGCQWSAAEMTSFLKNHGHLITATKLMAPELVNNNQTYMNTILGDNGAVANVDILGTHIYGGGIVENATAKSLNKEVWMTEHLDTNYHYTANINTAVEIHNCLTAANFSAYIWWYGKRFYGPIGQDGMVTKRGYIMSHFARFIKPGAVRIGSNANSRTDVLISAYNSSDKKIIVAINTGGYTVNQKITMQNGTVATVVPYTTSELKNVEQGNAVTAVNNSFSFTLPAYSITTFVEQ